MKTLYKLAVAAAIALSSTTLTFALEYTKGVVKKVDMTQKKVTIIHEELVSLEMPAMTMVFRTANDELLAKLKEGQNIEFVAARLNGKLTVTDVK
jgi:Cu/Ag efflux protein CusF